MDDMTRWVGDDSLHAISVNDEISFEKSYIKVSIFKTGYKQRGDSYIFKYKRKIMSSTNLQLLNNELTLKKLNHISGIILIIYNEMHEDNLSYIILL